MKENHYKGIPGEFRKDLFWSFVILINYLMMSAAAEVMILLIHYTYKIDNSSIHFRVNISLLLFLVLYIIFSNVYDGLRIATLRISEMIYSQTLASLVSDLFLYMVLWLITGHFISVLYPIIILVIQFLLASVWSFSSHKLFFQINKPSKTMLIYNRRSGLKRLVHEYGLEKRFDVKNIYHVSDIIDDLSLLDEYDTVFLSDIHSKERNKILKYCVSNHIHMFLIPRVGDTLMSGAKAIHMFHLPMLEVNGYKQAPYYVILKRTFDIMVSLLALVILSPVFLVTAIAIKATDGGPVFYKQERMTLLGRKFMIHKFRSMRVDAEKDGIARLSTGSNDDRITPVGKIIRACRIDELPQLIDILKGDLSVVGPRPEREAIALQYEKEMPEFRLRLLAKAGLTGYAQIYGKYNTTPYDKLQMDLMYISHQSFIMDLKICFATVKILFLPESTEGVAEGSITAMQKETKPVSDIKAKVKMDE